MKPITSSLMGLAALALSALVAPAQAAPAQIASAHLATPIAGTLAHDVHHRQYRGRGHIVAGPIRTHTTRTVVRRYGSYQLVRVCNIRYQNVRAWRHGRAYTERRILARNCHHVRHYARGHNYGHGYRGGITLQFGY